MAGLAQCTCTTAWVGVLSVPGTRGVTPGHLSEPLGRAEAQQGASDLQPTRYLENHGKSVKLKQNKNSKSIQLDTFMHRKRGHIWKCRYMGSPSLHRSLRVCGSWQISHSWGKNSTLFFTKAIRANFWVCEAATGTRSRSYLEGEALCFFPLCKLQLETCQDSGAGSSNLTCWDLHTTQLLGRRILDQPETEDTPQAWRTTGLLHPNLLQMVGQELTHSSVTMRVLMWVLGSLGLPAFLYWWGTGKEHLCLGNIGSGLQNTNK